MSTAYLVESIPTGLEAFRTPDGHTTENVLPRLVEQARTRIDLTAMYWNLLASPTKNDEIGLTEERLAELGAGHGKRLFDALANAAGRGVRIRILQSPGFGEAPESDILQAQFPALIEIRQVEMTDWYGTGIMHHKLWIFDEASFYLGSANMDWNSLIQVKELGIVVEDAPELAGDVLCFFEAWWHFHTLTPDTRTVYDPAIHHERPVPAWSALVAEAERAPHPLDQPDMCTAYNIQNPLRVTLNDVPATAFISSSPPELCAPGRANDLDTLLYTINDARASVCLSFMNYVPLGYPEGEYDPVDDKIKIDGEIASPIWWPALNDALLHAAITRGVHVRLLVSRWTYTSPYTEPFLRALRDTARAALANPRLTSGQIEVKWFIIPGWDRVLGINRSYPGHSRVNHPKYIVTDRRLNIGTSNISWDYFATVSGTSFNSDHADLVRQLQAVFERDWESAYAHPLV